MAGTAEISLRDRAGEIAGLESLLDDAVAGRGRAVAIVGCAGIGKTTLLHHTASAARERGMCVLEARGMELEGDFPFGVVRQLFEPVLVEAAQNRRGLLDGPAALAERAIDPRTSSSASDALSGVLHGLYWLTANLAADRPLALVLDDVHWSDVPSLRFVHYLAARIEGVPVAVLLALRPAEPGAPTAELEAALADPAVAVLEPAPLSREGVAEVLAWVFGRPPSPEFAAACAEASGGNPFLLRELARTLADDGVSPDASGAAAVASASSVTVSRSVLRRLARLSEAAQRLAAVTAVLGRAATPLRAARLAELEPTELQTAADAMIAAGILRRGLPLEFSHPLVRSSVYADLPPLQRARWHGTAADVLQHDGAPPEEIAIHLLQTDAGARPDRVEVLRRAARRAMARAAPGSAARYLARALEEPPDSGRAPAVLLELGAAERRAGAFEAAVRRLEEALELAEDPEMRTRAAVELARVLTATTGVPAAVAVVEREIERLAGHDRELELRLEAELAALGQMDLTTAGRVAHRLDRFAELPGETPAERLVLANLSRRAWQTGASAAEATSIAERALGGESLIEEAGLEGSPLAMAFITLCFADRLEEAERYLRAVEDQARRDGSRIALATSEAGRCLIHFRRGDIGALDRGTGALVDEPPERLGMALVLALYLFLEARIERGEHEAAERFLADRGLDGALPGVWAFVGFRRARGRLRLAQGRVEQALADFAEQRRVMKLWDLDLSPNAPWRDVTALALHHAGREDEARAVAEDLHRQAQRWGTPRLLGTAALVRGIVEHGDLARLTDALEHFENSPNRLDCARALIEIGAAMRSGGRRADARESLTRGVDLAATCGGQALVDRGLQELRALGARPRRVHASGAASLTAGETRVAELAAAGMSNKEIAQTLFVTTKTVEKHLSSVYAKLRVGSRRDVAAALRA